MCNQITVYIYLLQLYSNNNFLYIGTYTFGLACGTEKIVDSDGDLRISQVNEIDIQW